LLAGLQSVPGALVAGIIVGIAESLAMGYVDPLTEGGMSLVTPFLIMLLVLIIRPEGLFGWKRIERL
jgi:branched-chain amino acid transport system permease protein